MWIETSIGRMTTPGLVVVPCVDWMYALTVRSLLNMMMRHARPTLRIEFLDDPGTVASKRNRAAEMLLAEPRMEFLLQIDSDMMVPPDLVERLLGHEREIVGAWAISRRPPLMPEALAYPDPREPILSGSGLRECYHIGACALLVRRAAFEAMQPPWFVAPNEDYNFCHRARHAGLQVWCDSDTVVGHVGTTVLGPTSLYDWYSSREGQRCLGQDKPDDVDPSVWRELRSRIERLRAALEIPKGGP